MHPAAETREPPAIDAPRAFIADAMLGRLARWLRILGYDTAYEKIILDNNLVERTLHENRWLLTRDGYEEASPRVPPFVAQQHTRFTRCAKCARVYWPGTHWAHLRAQLERLRPPQRGTR